MKRKVSKKLNWRYIVVHAVRTMFFYTLIIILGILLEMDIILLVVGFSVFVFFMLLLNIININKNHFTENDNQIIDKKEKNNGSS